jgi:hypothetical protein
LPPFGVVASSTLLSGIELSAKLSSIVSFLGLLAFLGHVAGLVAIKAEPFPELSFLVGVAGFPARFERGVKLHWLGLVTLLLASLLSPLVAGRSSLLLELAFIETVVDLLSQLDHLLEVVGFVGSRDLILHMVLESHVVLVANSLISLVGESGVLLKLCSVRDG